MTRPHALVMLKLLALSDRYSNIRGPREARHNREEAQTHAADIVAIVAAQADPAVFKQQFAGQLQPDPVLGVRVLRIFSDFFRESAAPGLLVYGEHLAANRPAGRETRAERREETERAHRLIANVLAPPEFHALSAAFDRTCNWQRHPALVEEYLDELENHRLPITHDRALEHLPGTAFGGPFRPGTRLGTTASAAMSGLSAAEGNLLRAYLQARAQPLAANEELRRSFPHALSG